MTETVISNLITFTLRADVAPRNANLQTVNDITLTAAYKEDIPFLRYYAEDLLKDLTGADFPDLIGHLEKRHPTRSTSPMIVLTKRLVPRRVT
jgi:uncharacterized protein YvpB